MNKPAVIQASIISLASLVAADISYELATHDVAVATVVAAATSVLTNGIFMAARSGRSPRTFICPNEDCTLRIATTGNSDEENDYLSALAADHSRHTTAGA